MCVKLHLRVGEVGQDVNVDVELGEGKRYIGGWRLMWDYGVVTWLVGIWVG